MSCDSSLAANSHSNWGQEGWKQIMEIWGMVLNTNDLPINSLMWSICRISANSFVTAFLFRYKTDLRGEDSFPWKFYFLLLGEGDTKQDHFPMSVYLEPQSLPCQWSAAVVCFWLNWSWMILVMCSIKFLLCWHFYLLFPAYFSSYLGRSPYFCLSFSLLPPLLLLILNLRSRFLWVKNNEKAAKLTLEC